MKKLLLGVAAGLLAASCAASESSASQSDEAVKSSSANVERLDLNTPEGAMLAMRKVQCSLVDGEAVTYYWFGRAYSRRMGERDKNIFNVEGMNVRACSTVNDPERGLGYKLVTREILLYKDAKTGEVLKTWENPWTGEEVEVMHVANDPVNSSGYVTGRDGKPATFGGDVMDDRFQMSFTVPLFYPSPLASEYEKEIGGTYHATEMFNFFGFTDDLTDMSKNTANVSVGWARMSDWLPWMNMQGREGTIYMHTAGRKLESWDDMSETMKSEIRTHYPEYVAPPPLDDPRKNMTSWEYYKQVRDGEIKLPKR
ncbi:uncharacterized protein DUF1838 [Litorimonas taeanensis]|uniref:Uncharacterized protein DUF1838 n=1 Tax=Litorimonas taeanensis TaxID=568099 RepID=A0A420WM47_9PROT|nr:DUF1838 family protein [Litorimonas taeanensis]RKQ71976.1 uncharacterized protein DUF1838 [Litorimonas taeanensis]